MAKQTFSVGQTLTAAQMTSLQQTAMLGGAASAKTASYTLVAADAGSAISMSNAGATTITVNTALFAAGDTVHITNLGAGVCTITAGTATVNSSASLALAQYESGFLDFTSTSAAIFVKGAGAAAASGGMTLISETTASALSSLSLSGIADTYKELYLVWEGIKADASGNNFDIRLNNDSGANYAYGLFGIATNNSGTGIIDSDSSNSGTSVVGAGGRYSAFGDDGNGGTLVENSMGWLRISNYASASKYKHYMGNWWNYDVNGGNTGRNACVVQGVYKSTSAVTSIDVVRTVGASTFSNAANTSIRLYGLS
jgi:hypothetical protein